MEKYLNEDEKELLSLIRYHRGHFDKMKETLGEMFPDDAVEVVEYLDKTEDLVWNAAKRRKTLKEAQVKHQEYERSLPRLTMCAECESGKERVPTGETKNQHGYMANCYHCEDCGADYVDGMPNNSKEQLEWYKDLEDFFKENQKDIDAMPDKQRENILSFLKGKKIIEEIYKKEQAALKRVQLADKAEEHLSKMLAQSRDYLLSIKLKNNWGDTPIGEC